MAQSLHVLFGQGHTMVPSVVKFIEHVAFGGGAKRIIEVLTENVVVGVQKVEQQIKIEADVAREEMQNISDSTRRMRNKISQFLCCTKDKPEPRLRHVTIEKAGRTSVEAAIPQHLGKTPYERPLWYETGSVGSQVDSRPKTSPMNGSFEDIRCGIRPGDRHDFSLPGQKPKKPILFDEDFLPAKPPRKDRLILEPDRPVIAQDVLPKPFDRVNGSDPGIDRHGISRSTLENTKPLFPDQGRATAPDSIKRYQRTRPPP